MADLSAASQTGRSAVEPVAGASVRTIKLLTFLMFMMFAMTIDAVGVIIPAVIKSFGLSMAAAGSFHYATMLGLGVAGLGLGFLSDLLGRKAVIILGLATFALDLLLFAVNDRFGVFLLLLFVSGLAIGLFKTAALGLIGDVSTSISSHTRTLIALEGFFGVGAIIGPLIATRLVLTGASWKWLYVIAGAVCLVLVFVALLVRYPRPVRTTKAPVNLARTLRMMRSPFALGFGIAVMLYIGVESAVYVWTPTYLQGYSGPAGSLALYAIPAFFILRAAGRFLGAWLFARIEWTAALAVCGLLILGCFIGAVAGGRDMAVYLLPLSGLFMSVIFPTLNSKGINCFPKEQHGAAAGVLLFFTCSSAVMMPLGMGLVSDALGDPKWGFMLALGVATLLCAGLLGNWLLKPSQKRHRELEASEY
jgi:fucose permease